MDAADVTQDLTHVLFTADDVAERITELAERPGDDDPEPTEKDPGSSGDDTPDPGRA